MRPVENSPPSPDRTGRWIPIPHSRRLVTDLLHFARQVPGEGVIGNWNVARVAALRQSVAPKIGWTALFLKAFGLVSAQCPVLRQIYMSWPVPHLYQHPQTVARITVARQFRGEDWLFFARINSPERTSLVELQLIIDRFQQSAVGSVPSFQRQIRLSSTPVFIRRPLWWWALHSSGARHAHHFGTFAMTTISSLGAVAVQPKCLSTTTLTFGPVDQTGHVDVRIVFDHRVFDGAVVADILSRWERALQAEVGDELESLARQPLTSGRQISDQSTQISTGPRPPASHGN